MRPTWAANGMMRRSSCIVYGGKWYCIGEETRLLISGRKKIEVMCKGMVVHRFSIQRIV